VVRRGPNEGLIPCLIVIFGGIMALAIGYMVVTTPGLTPEQMIMGVAFAAVIFAIAIGVTVSCTFGKARGRIG
jgi:hypothetical protein